MTCNYSCPVFVAATANGQAPAREDQVQSLPVLNKDSALGRRQELADVAVPGETQRNRHAKT